MTKEIKTVSLIGLGAMGSWFAPRLQRTFGDRFRVIADGRRKERLETEGVEINGEALHFHVTEPSETGDPADLIIIATKGYGLQQAIADIRNQVGADTQILAVLNGIEAEDELIRAYGAEHVLYSLMRVSIVMKDHRTSYNPEAGRVHFGEKHGNREGTYTDRVRAVKDVFDRAGIPCMIDEDMEKAIWFKYACNVSENMTCALLGIPFGVFRTCSDADILREDTFREIIRLANARGIALSEDDLIRQRKTIAALPGENKPSTLQDLEAGKKTEVGMFAGTAMRLGQEAGLPMPYCTFFYHAIRVKEALLPD